MNYNYTTINSGSGTWPIKASKNDLEKVQDSLLRAFARKGTTWSTYLYIVIPKHNLEKVAEVLQRSQTLSRSQLIEQYVDPVVDTATIKIGFIPAPEWVSINPLEDNVDYPVVFQDGKVTIIENFVNTKEMKEMKENNMLNNVINTNKQAAVQAGYLKAGRVANKALEGIVRKRFPTLPDTPFTGLVLANLVDVLGKQVKPSAELARVSGAMVTSAYLDLYTVLDLEGMVEELLAAVPAVVESDTVKPVYDTVKPVYETHTYEAT